MLRSFGAAGLALYRIDLASPPGRGRRPLVIRSVADGMTRHRVKVVALVVVMALAGCAGAGSPPGVGEFASYRDRLRGAWFRGCLCGRISAVLSGAAQPAAAVQTMASAQAAKQLTASNGARRWPGTH